MDSRVFELRKSNAEMKMKFHELRERNKVLMAQWEGMKVDVGSVNGKRFKEHRSKEINSLKENAKHLLSEMHEQHNREAHRLETVKGAASTLRFEISRLYRELEADEVHSETLTAQKGEFAEDKLKCSELLETQKAANQSFLRALLRILPPEIAEQHKSSSLDVVVRLIDAEVAAIRRLHDREVQHIEDQENDLQVQHHVLKAQMQELARPDNGLSKRLSDAWGRLRQVQLDIMKLQHLKAEAAREAAEQAEALGLDSPESPVFSPERPDSMSLTLTGADPGKEGDSLESKLKGLVVECSALREKGHLFCKKLDQLSVLGVS